MQMPTVLGQARLDAFGFVCCARTQQTCLHALLSHAPSFQPSLKPSGRLRLHEIPALWFGAVFGRLSFLQESLTHLRGCSERASKTYYTKQGAYALA